MLNIPRFFSMLAVWSKTYSICYKRTKIALNRIPYPQWHCTVGMSCKRDPTAPDTMLLRVPQHIRHTWSLDSLPPSPNPPPTPTDAAYVNLSIRRRLFSPNHQIRYDFEPAGESWKFVLRLNLSSNQNFISIWYKKLAKIFFVSSCQSFHV